MVSAPVFRTVSISDVYDLEDEFSYTASIKYYNDQLNDFGGWSGVKFRHIDVS